MPIPEEIATILREANTCAQSSEQVCYLTMLFYGLFCSCFAEGPCISHNSSLGINYIINVGLAVYINH